MRDCPPDSLLARLVELKLCTATDVQRARRLVRRMTRDLPAFDSVWIDALAQLNVLTPFQSRWLEASPPETLLAGEYQLLDGLGHGTASQTLLARTPDRRRVVLKRLTPPTDHAAAVELRLQLLVERSRHAASPHLALADEVLTTPTGFYVVSRHVPGLNLSELLIRRGRFPGPVVAAIADQLLGALAALHPTGAAHGDLRLTKIRLTDRGQIVLVDSGLTPALSPELLIHAVRSPEEADVVAPERIGTNQSATAASDLYAVGCVLWQLLTGRPPFPQADPLSKLAAHQTRRVPDVRDLAPDTPAKLAELILQLTAPQPADRPSTAEAARRRLGLRGRAGSAGLIRFRRQFDTAVPHLAVRKLPRPSRWHALTAAVLLLGVGVVVTSDRGLRTGLLHIAERAWSEGVKERQVVAPSEDTNSAAEPADGLPLPKPDARGVVRLTESGPYRAEELTQVGPLTVRAAENVRPQILIDDAAWRITAQHVVLEGIDVVWKHDTGPIGPAEMVLLQSQRFELRACRFLGPPPRRTEEPVELAAVAWEPNDRRDPQAGVLAVERTSFLGTMHAIACRETPRHIHWQQVLKTQPGSAVFIDKTSAAQGLKLVFDNVTLRDSGPLVACAGPLTEQASASLLEIEAANCVFDIAPAAPLVELRGPKTRDDWPEAIRVSGDGCLLPPGAILLAAVDSASDTTSALHHDDMQFEGLFSDEFEFAGPNSRDARDSQLIKTHAPRRSEVLPGIEAGRMPAER